MQIGDVAKQFKIPVDTLRYYDRIGLLSPKRRGKMRWYSPEICQRLKAIVQMKNLLFSLEEIQGILALDELVDRSIDADELDQQAIAAMLDRIRSKYQDVEAMEENIRTVKAGLAEIIAKVKKFSKEEQVDE